MPDLLIWLGVLLIGGVLGPVLVLLAAGAALVLSGSDVIGALLADQRPTALAVELFFVSLWLFVAAGLSLFAQIRLFAENVYADDPHTWPLCFPAWLVGALFTAIILMLGFRIGLIRWLEWSL